MIIATTKKRILQFVEYKQITKQEFFRITGLSRGLLDADKLNQSIEDGKVATIIASFPELSLEWLITGKGEMIRDVDSGQRIKEPPPPLIQKQKGIPLIPTKAESGVFNCDIQINEYECEFFDVPTFKGADFLITVRGDSMVPNYKPGDIVACKKIEIGTYIQWNRVYVIDTDQGPIIKRIKPAQSKDILLIISDNVDFSPFDLPVDKIRHLALVLGSIRPE